ncbi:alpha/beta fold hydrolase [Streptomyces sp. NPDC101227]|uniref:alpha/beta fold hydrolase n=1 Tax=Streptomyces sp. NPDC101227 TaxID=3366136 RepID=UPI0037F2A518
MTRPQTPTVVLLHALSLDSSMWRPQRHALERRGLRVLAFDQRGFGGAPLGADPPSLDTVAEDLAAALDAGGHGRVVLVGSSMGGYVAMRFLRHHAHRVDGLVLTGTRASADSAAAAAGREGFARTMTDDRLRPELIAKTTPLLLGATTRAERPEVLTRLLDEVTAASPAAVAWAQRAVAARPDSFDVLRATTVPALVIAGAEDELVPPDEAQRMAAALPRGRLVTVERAGHLTPLEAPDVFTGALTRLLDDIAGHETLPEGHTC